MTYQLKELGNQNENQRESGVVCRTDEKNLRKVNEVKSGKKVRVEKFWPLEPAISHHVKVEVRLELIFMAKKGKYISGKYRSLLKRLKFKFKRK